MKYDLFEYTPNEANGKSIYHALQKVKNPNTFFEIIRALRLEIQGGSMGTGKILIGGFYCSILVPLSEGAGWSKIPFS